MILFSLHVVGSGPIRSIPTSEYTDNNNATIVNKVIIVPSSTSSTLEAAYTAIRPSSTFSRLLALLLLVL